MVIGDSHNYDVIIIGGGIAGAATARELSRHRLSVLVLEKEPDVSFGATKGSHAIAHCGLITPDAPLKNRGEVTGNQMLGQVCRELDVPFKRIGKLLVAFDQEETRVLHFLAQGGRDNGVRELEVIEDQARLKELEPAISPEIVAALHTPATAVCDPWALCMGLMENAVANGVELRLGVEVSGVEPMGAEGFALKTSQGELRARYVVNASGPHAGRIARMVGDESFKVVGSRHQRIILDKHTGPLVRHLVRGVAGETPNGDLVMPTIDGNLMIGSKVEVVEDLEDGRTTREGLEDYTLPRARRLIPELPMDLNVKPFSAFIPLVGPEYHIKGAPEHPGFVSVVLGVSGFTSAVPMGQYIVREVLAAAGLSLVEKDDYQPERRDLPHFQHMDRAARAELIARVPAFGHIVCRCEQVSEGEIVEALHRGATTRDGVKFRTRAGMGRCQANFCGHKVLQIMQRELEVPIGSITKKGPDSYELAPEDN